MNKEAEYLLPDVDDDNLTIVTGPDILGSRKGAVAEFSGDWDPWCPNADQLRTLRDRCDAILVQHAAKKAGPMPYRVADVVGVNGEIIEIESGTNLPGAPDGSVIRIDLQGNEDGPSWVGGLDELAALRTAINDVWELHNPSPIPPPSP
jgi:hypothetical protein